jgi:hypothetical protein
LLGTESTNRYFPPKRWIGLLEQRGRVEGDGNGDVEGEEDAADEVDPDL